MNKSKVELRPTDSEERKQEDKSENTQEVDDHDLQRGFPCPEVGCVKIFVSSKTLEMHLDAGKHYYKVYKESTYDVIKRNWAFRCTEVGTAKASAKITDNVDKRNGQMPSLPSACSEKGWALKKAKKSVRFSQHVEAFLNQIFLKGEETGQKANPTEVSSLLRKMKTPNGEKRFQRSEWLTVQQITSYFSRLSVLHRSGRTLESAEDDEEALQRRQVSSKIVNNLEI